MLPLGIFMVQKMGGSTVSGLSQAEVEAKIDALVKELKTEKPVETQVSKAEVEIAVTGVVYASESGVVKVAGVAPSDNATLFVLSVIHPPSQIPEISNDVTTRDVLGYTAEVKAVRSKSGGSFIFEYPVKSTDEGVLEMLLMHEKSSKTIKFDLGKKKQIL